MSFDPDQIKELIAPLDRANVKTRNQSGRQLSYVEGWHVIEEANRIFGFDGWTRETIDIRCVVEKPREIGQREDPGFGVTYTAKVRVNVGGVVREGCGAGHGIDRDLGQAHESAIKEAETDAMKLALMTFGNQFGLALYDKEQAQVSSISSPPLRAVRPAEDATRPLTISQKAVAKMVGGVNSAATTAPSPVQEAADRQVPPPIKEKAPADLEKIKDELAVAATRGTPDMMAYWEKLPLPYKRLLKFDKERLKSIAKDADLQRARAG